VQLILLDPTHEIRRRAERVLPANSVEIVTAASVAAVASSLSRAASDDVLIADVRKNGDGVELAERLNEQSFSGRVFLLIDPFGQARGMATDRDDRVESLEFSAARVDTLLGRLATHGGDRSPTRIRSGAFHGLVGRSKPMRELFARIEKAAVGDANVCIYGESGTGKELIARAIHQLSDRRSGPLVTFDCTAVPEGLAESQLFGHVRGAFTGAIEHRDGVFAQADNGTLFIDELCELSKPLQAKLLRVVQGREFVKVGGTKTLRTNIRLVTATNRDPKQAVDAGAFRADLYYRVAVVIIKAPPLRERRDDIPALVEHFVTYYATCYKKRIRGVQPSAIDRMLRLPWPGNVRQLENFLAQAVVLSEADLLTERDLFTDDPAPLVAMTERFSFEPGLPLREVERRHILRSLQSVQGNRTEAAKSLGISVRCLQYKLKAYGHDAETANGGELDANSDVLEAKLERP
jgi:two-component system, NtrC family, response regulator AtoC